MKRILILGAGTMGLQIGLQAAAWEFDVTFFDPFEKALTRARERVDPLLSAMVSHHRIRPDQADAARNRIDFTHDPETAGKDADLINESVPEDPRLKIEVFSMFNGICPAHTIFTTNSSTLVPSMIAEGTGRPDRFAALHFHDLLLTNVVDIMPHPGTSPEALAAIRTVARAMDQFPIELKKEQNGYVFNTMLSELLRSALGLASRKVASVEDIDRAWMGIMKTKTGPFGIMDSVGLDTVHKITAYWARVRDDAAAMANADFLKKKVDKGDLGVKTGQGFYSYPDPEFLDPTFMNGIH
jgi:3-hydroxybutyryl-CoA dehydrogenase